MLNRAFVAAGVAGLLATSALAQTAATATADLNIRAEPSPSGEILGVIPADAGVDVEGCGETVNWCRVTYEGTQGWAYGDYLVTQVENQPTVIYQYPEIHRIEVQDTTAESAAGGGLTGALVGAVIACPVGAVAGAAIGGAAGAATDPGPQVTSYVIENPVDPVYLEGEVVVGAGLPETVTLYPVPESELRYVYVNNVPVLVNEERRIVTIVR